jgi:hypothetical protein
MVDEHALGLHNDAIDFAAMERENDSIIPVSQTARSTEPEQPSHPASAYRRGSYGRHRLVILNWIFALLTLPAALLSFT